MPYHIPGIVTRCPLELHFKKSTDAAVPWRGRFRYKPQGQDFDNDKDDFRVDENFTDSLKVEQHLRQGRPV